MRSLELLLRDYPEKTGKEILQIQEQEKQEAKKEQQKRDKKQIAFVNDLNQNGGYFKGCFGTTQYYMYNITDVSLIEGKLYANVERITCFYARDLKHSKDMLDFKIEEKEYECLYNYSLQNENRITKEDYLKLYNVLDIVIPSFWNKELETIKKEFSK